MSVVVQLSKKKKHSRRKLASLLDTPAPLAVARITRDYLQQARKAQRRLETKGDSDALHDLRVALRRLRSTLRIYRDVVEYRPVPQKLRRNLKRLAHAAGSARDTDVALAWLRQERKNMQNEERAACDRLIADWKARREDEYRTLNERIEKTFVKTEKSLLDTLRRWNGAAAPRLRQTAGSLLHEQVTELSNALKHITSDSDTNAIHGARIEAKRLRYLLEPIATQVPEGIALLKTLKSFQDDFGALCDCQMISEELIAMAPGYGAERITKELSEILGYAKQGEASGPDVSAGLIAMARRLAAERKRRYGGIEQQYLGERPQTFLAPFRDLADWMIASSVHTTMITKVHERPLGQ